MNRLKELKITIRIVEGICLALLTVCFSLPMALIFREGSLRADLLWAFGAILPVQGIREVCERVERKKTCVLLSVGILALAVLIPPMPVRRLYYGIVCIPILLAGTVIGRPGGKIVLTVPRVYFLIASLLVYALGKIGELPLLSLLAILIAVLQILDYLLYQNQLRLLRTVRDDPSSHVSVRSIVSLNRKLVIGFFVIGAMAVIAVPWLLSQRGPVEDTVPVAETGEYSIRQTEHNSQPRPETEKVYQYGEEKKWDYKTAEYVFDTLVLLLVAAALIVAAIAIIYILRSIIGDKDKHSEPREDQFVVERLPQEKHRARTADEAGSSYDRKIRKKYSRLILQSVKDRSKLPPLTPTELEDLAAQPDSPERRQLHDLYTKARYTAEPADREDYRRVKDLLRSLERQQEQTSE